MTMEGKTMVDYKKMTAQELAGHLWKKALTESVGDHDTVVLMESAQQLLVKLETENFRLSAQCGRYYKAIREHCKGINRLLRKKDHHRNKAERYAAALQRIIDYPEVSGWGSNIMTPPEIAHQALNPPQDAVILSRRELRDKHGIVSEAAE